jgi:hypothetical protein
MRRRHHLLGHDVQPLIVLAAFLVLGASVAVAARTGGSWWAILAGIIAPDLTFLAAGAPRMDIPHRLGPQRRLHPPRQKWRHQDGVKNTCSTRADVSRLNCG